jgi:hypothetical protein
MRWPVLLYTLAAAVLMAAVVVELTRDDPQVAAAPTPIEAGPGGPTGTPTPAPTTAPLSPIPAAGPGLAVGVTEYNPHLVAADVPAPEPWESARQALGQLDPAFYRLVIEWDRLQPRAAADVNLDNPETGCMREVGPCLPWAGVRQQLRALASRQKQDPARWQTLVVLMWTPEWAAAAPSGCEKDDTESRARAPRPDTLPAYKQVILDVLKVAEEEGATLRFWSPWNEPNLPPFLSPQRAECDADSPSLAPGVYAELARTMSATLGEAPGEQQLVIGETAGLLKDTKLVTSVGEFIRGLPQDVVCASTVYSQHAYIGGDDPVRQAVGALADHDCPEPHTIWITETGVGPAPEEYSAVKDPAAAGCRDLHERLVRWWNDPLVTVAFQYTFREDDKFPVGLFSTDLTEKRPSLNEWLAWGGARPATAPPPASACGT